MAGTFILMAFLSHPPLIITSNNQFLFKHEDILFCGFVGFVTFSDKVFKQGDSLQTRSLEIQLEVRSNWGPYFTLVATDLQ